MVIQVVCHFTYGHLDFYFTFLNFWFFTSNTSGTFEVCAPESDFNHQMRKNKRLYFQLESVQQ